MIKNELNELRAAYEQAEKSCLAAARRAQWLERRLFEAATDEEYAARATELETQEAALKDLGKTLTLARYDYVSAELAARAEK